MYALFFSFFLLPLFLGAVTVEDAPFHSIEGKSSLLKRPEGIAFSPLGDLVAIANSDANNILFYRLNETTPAYVFKSVKQALNYPHDIDFSKDGTYLAVASRYNNRVTIHKRNEKGFYDEKPSTIIEGKSLSLHGISCVKVHPNGKMIAMGEVGTHKVALVNCDGENFTHVQTISATIDVLDRPDGIAFSKDGTLLAVISHGAHALLLYEKCHDGEGYTKTPVQVLKSEFHFPHSVCFHPVDDTLVVSSAGGRKTLTVFKKLSDVAPFYSQTPDQIFGIYNPETVHHQNRFPEEGGVKGVAFSPDGRILGLSASDIADSARAILFFKIKED